MRGGLRNVKWLVAGDTRGKHEGPPTFNHCNQIGYAGYGIASSLSIDFHLPAGSSSIVHEKTHRPLLSTLSLIVETAVNLIKDEHRVVIVSSGAIAVGLQRMGVERRPKHLPRVQVQPSIQPSVWVEF